MANNTQSRKWLMVINNPSEAGLDHSAISEIVQKFCPVYFCMADEIATTGTYHTHVFFCTSSPARFSTIKKRFPTAHIEKAYGTPKENRDYITKTGIWADTSKAETAVPNTFQEWGELPADSEDKAPEMFQIMRALRSARPLWRSLKNIPILLFVFEKLKSYGKRSFQRNTVPKTASWRCTISMAVPARARHGAFSKTITRVRFAVSPITAAETVCDSTPTTVRAF